MASKAGVPTVRQLSLGLLLLILVVVSRVTIGGLTILVVSELIKLKPYIEIKSIVLGSIKR